MYIMVSRSHPLSSPRIPCVFFMAMYGEPESIALPIQTVECIFANVGVGGDRPWATEAQFVSVRPTFALPCAIRSSSGDILLGLDR